MAKMKKQKSATPAANNNKKGAGAQANKLQKNVGAPVINTIKKKKLAKIANQKTKALLGDTSLVNNNDNIVKKSGLTKSQMRRMRLKKAKAGKAEKLARGAAMVEGVKREQANQPKKDDSKKKHSALNETIHKAFLTGLLPKSTNSDVRVALIGAGANSIGAVRVVKSRKGIICIASFKDEKSLNEVLEMNGRVKVLGKVIHIDRYKTNQTRASESKEAVEKKNLTTNKLRVEEKTE